jgi:dihydroorotate dehydrogenase electron transfer subunit
VGPGRRHILIAGGFGAPPLYFLAQELSVGRNDQPSNTDTVTVVNAARTRDLLVASVEFSSLDLVIHTITDDGSHGRRGLATEMLCALLEEADAEGALPRVQLYACGPMPMLRAVGEIAVPLGIPCQVSVETSMPCGIGLCYGCAVRTRDDSAPQGYAYSRACWDGPVFEAGDVFWGSS